MKNNKNLKAIIFIIVLIIASLILVSCNGVSDGITVVSREAGSGTRDGFESIIGLDGDLTNKAIILNSTGAVMSKVESTKGAMGYISLGSLNDTVKALKVEGVAANAENIANSTYSLQRNFNIITKKGVEMSALAKDFIAFIQSNEGQNIAESKGLVKIAAIKSYTTPAGSMSGNLAVSGSTSVDPLMNAYKDAYIAKHPKVSIAIQATGSSAGIQDVNNANAENAPYTIGMSSRDLKSKETQVEATVIAIDGIAVIVNKNVSIENITKVQLLKIYKGEISSYKELI